MQRKQLVATLTRLTEALGPGPGTNDGDLRRARVRLARALVAGQAADELGASLAFTDVWERDVHAVEDDELERIALGAIDDRRRRRAESRPTLDVFLAPRTLPVRHPFDPREPASVVGMRATETLGPFVDGDGIARWIDLIQPLRQLPLARGTGAAAVFGSLPVLGRQTDPRRLRLGRGSVWLAARLLARNAPTGSFTGFRIRRGTLTLDGGAAVTANRIRLGPATIATLTVELDVSAPPVAATGPASAEHPASSPGIGGDATAATVTLPATATIVLHPTAATVADLAPFGVEAYGSDPIALARSVGSLPRYVPALRHVLVPATPTPDTFDARLHLSALFWLSGSAQIAGAGWALPVAQTTADKLGPAEGAGAVALLLGTGLEIGWSGLAQPALPASPNLLVGPGMLSVTFTQTEPEYGQKFLLWDERRTGGPPRRSTAEYRFSKGSTLTYLAQPGLEALLATGGTAAAKVDRPVRADGRRLPLALPTAQLGIWDQGQGEQVFLFGTDPNAQEASHLALALDNALLRVRPSGSLLLTGKLTGDEVPEGRMTLGFSLRSLVHTLPDPYAARRFHGDREGDVDIGVISSRVAWTHPNTPELAFSIPESVDGGGRRGRLTFATLLDVSSAADQLGVFVGPRSQGQPLVVHGLTVHAPGNRVGVFTVPEISWEPVYNHPSSPPPAPIAPPHDGGPSTFTVPTVHLVPVAPAPMLADLLAGIENGGEVDSRITLPFGIEARIRDSVGATFALNQPLFPDDMAGALQVRMQPAGPWQASASFTGSANTMGDPVNGYGARILGGHPTELDPAEFFNADFTATVPLRRYDFCGYGASVFSDWRQANPDHPGVIKAHFNVFVGRTAYEVIQVQSFIYPWAVRVVRTITLERLPAGSVIRFDSGWQPASDGLFQFPKTAPPTPQVTISPTAVHPGAVRGVVGVRAIRNDGPSFELGFRVWQPVRFDADVLLHEEMTILEGASGPHHVPSRDVRGFLLGPLTPQGVGNGTKPLPNVVQLRQLLEAHPAGGPVSATVEVAHSETKLRASLVDVTGVLGGGTTSLVAALRGSPVLPGDGAWSVARRRRAVDEAPQVLPPHLPVPLVKHRNQTTWHYADPADILALDANPTVEYGFVQATGTQKLFFARPRVVPNQTAYALPEQPKLADVAALFNATGAFPNLGAALEFVGPLINLDVSGGGVQIHREFDVPPTVGPKTLVDFGVVKVPIVYENQDHVRSHVTVDIQPGSWSIEIRGVSFPILMTAPPLGTLNDPVLRIVGDVVASSTAAPTLRNLDVVYGGALASVQSVFANISEIAKYIPGGPVPTLDVGFSDGQLTIRNVFPIPKLPLGLGFIKDISLDLGMSMRLAPMSLTFTAGIGSPEKPFTWLVSPLSGSGVVQVGVKDGDPAVLIRAGIGVGLAIDVGIASGSASVILAFQAEVVGGNIMLQGLLTAQASVDVLAGLASASLSLTAGLGITPAPLPPRLPPSTKPLDSVTFVASAAVGIHITVCWLVSIDFDGHWQFSQTIDVPDIGAALPI